MPKVRFLPAGFETEITVGTRLIDLTDRFPEASVPYSCRSASCGTCRVRVLQGAAGLSAIEEDERDVLDVFGDEEDVRLCCQLKLEREVTFLELEVAE